MMTRGMLPAAIALAVLALVQSSACAERVRYHFAPADLCGNTAQTPAGPCNAIGERVSYLGISRTPYNGVLRPTQMVTFIHPVTKANVSVPLALPPDSTPKMEYSANRVVFDYGIYQVDVRFLPDGSVDVIYDSGLRRLQ
jgi:hypothetical protein